jgi:hypothetical protein
LRWQFGIDVDKPKDIPARGIRPGIHLPGTTPLALNEAIAKACSQINRSIRASPIGYNNLRSRRALSKVREKSPDQGRLIENRNNDRDQHLTSFQVAPQNCRLWDK